MAHSEATLLKNAKPHDIWKVTSGNRDERYSVRASDSPKPIERGEKWELISTFENYNEAQRERVALGRAQGKYTMPTKIKKDLPPFMEAMPDSPRVRRAGFLDMEIEDQENVLYAIVSTTGMPFRRVCDWLYVLPSEVDHIDQRIITSARAELDLRIAKKMVGHALANNSPASMSAVLYLTKVFLGWNEQGQRDPAEDPTIALGGAKALFDNLSVIETDRDTTTGETKGPSKVLQLVRGTKTA